MHYIIALSLLLSSAASAQAYLEGTYTSTGVTTGEVLEAVTDAGTLLRADRDAYAKSFVAQSTSADGGPAGEAFSCQQGTCTWRFAAGSQMTITCSNNACTWNIGEMTVPQLNLTALVTRGSNDAYQYAQPGTFWRDFPTADTTGCDTGSAGGRRFLSTDNRQYVCDGTTMQRVGFSLTNTDTLDFPLMNNNEDASMTMTVTGAVTTDVAICNPLVDLEPGVQVSYSRVTATNTVKVVLHDASGGSVNPAPANYRCTVVR